MLGHFKLARGVVGSCYTALLFDLPEEEHLTAPGHAVESSMHH